MFHSVRDDWRHLGLGSALLGEIESRMTGRGPSTLSALVPAEETRIDAYRNAGFTEKKTLRYIERQLAVQRGEATQLEELGGRMLPAAYGTPSAACVTRRTAGEATRAAACPP